MTTAPPFERLSRYRLIEALGRGSMGEVWLAEDTELPRRVAIKLLPSHLAEDRVAIERLVREARAAASVDHPNVVTVHDAGTHEGRPFVVMQRVEGETLERRLERGALPVPEAVALGRAIAGAFAEVHALGIVHRDLKPSNVMLTARGPKVLDFGVAAIRGASRLTATDASVGTPLTMSPEQIRGEEPDATSDLWALGVLLHWALAGSAPFDAPNAAAVIYRVMNEDPAPPSRSNPAVPVALDGVVARLLRKDRSQRYARAEDVLADLDRAVAAPAEAAPVPAAVPRLAVLPFEVMSTEPDDAFLAAGLTEDLIVDLARVEGLQVAARGEVVPYRDRNLPPRTVARELGTDFVLQGSVRRSGTRGRISAQLVRAADGQAVWAERFDRTLVDLFDVQAEVSKRIVEALHVALRPSERAMLDRVPTRNPEAYTFYLEARVLLDRHDRVSVERGVELLERAITLDPEFAIAHAALAEAHVTRAVAWWAGLEVAEPARRHAERALALDGDLGGAHFALALVCRLEGDAAGVLAELERARIDPGNPRMVVVAARGLMALGRTEEAMAWIERGRRVHPRNYSLLSAEADANDVLGRREALQRSLTEIREVLIDTLDRDPADRRAREILGIALVQVGERDAGIAQVERTLMGEPDSRTRHNAACAFAQAGMTERAIEQLRIAVADLPTFVTDWARRDMDLASLREHPEFIRMFGHD